MYYKATGRQIVKLKHGNALWIKFCAPGNNFNLFIPLSMLKNFHETKPVKGCDGFIEFDLPDWFKEKEKEKLKHFVK